MTAVPAAMFAVIPALDRLSLSLNVFIFTIGDCSYWYGYKYTNRKNKYIKKYNEISHDKIPEIRIHDFRHSHVSLLINNGVTSFTIAERLGHTTLLIR